MSENTNRRLVQIALVVKRAAHWPGLPWLKMTSKQPQARHDLVHGNSP